MGSARTAFLTKAGKHLSRRTIFAGAAAGSAGVWLAACSGGSDSGSSGSSASSGAGGSSAEPRRGGTLNVPSTPLRSVLDPHQATFPNMLRVWHNISHHLLEVDEKLQATNQGVAESWEIVDPKTLLFKLHEGITFHDKAPANGRAFTAEDVVYSLNRIQTPQPAFARRAQFQVIDSIVAVDPRTVRITTKEPNVPLLTYMGTMYNVMVNREAVEKYGDLAQAEGAIGVGPFMLDKYDKESGYTLVRNPKYFRNGLPYLDKVEVTVFADDAPRQAALRAGQLHMSDEQIRFVPELVQNNKNLQQVKFGSPFLAEFGMNQSVRQFADIRVRKAINLLVDRDKALAVAYGERQNGVYGAPITPLMEPYALSESQIGSMPGYRQPKAEDIAEAKKLMAAAGYANGFNVGAKTATEYIFTLEPFIPDLKSALNINIDLQVLEWAAYKKAEANKEVDAFGTGYQVEAEADALLRLFNHSKGTRNYVNYSDARADDLIQKQAGEFDTAKRIEICQEAQRYFMDQVPHGWQYGSAYNVRLMHPKLHGIVTVAANANGDRQDFTYAWLEK